MTSLALSFLVVAALILLPGAWLSFGLPLRDLGTRGRLALAVGLSPFVVGLEACLLLAAGVGFERTVLVICVIDLAAIVPVALALRGARLPQWRPAAGGVVLLALLSSCLVVPWWIWEGFRDLSYHGLIHTDYVYALTRGGIRPEEPALAGVELIYFWFGELYFAVVGSAADWAPTRVYLFVNLAWLLAGGVMAYELARGLGLGRPAALLTVAVLFLATGILSGISLAFVQDRHHRIFHLVGDQRYSPFLIKYRSFNLMPIGQTLLIGMAWIAVLATRRNVRFLGTLLALLLVAIGTLYTPLFPIGALWVGAFLALMALPHLPWLSDYAPRMPDARLGDVVRVGLLCTLAALLSVLFYEAISAGRSEALVGFPTLSKLLKKVRYAAAAFAPLLLLAWPALWRAVRLEHAGTTLLAACALGSAAVHLGLRVGEYSEYKFMFGASIAMAPLVAAGLEPWLKRLRSFGSPAVIATTAVLTLVYLLGQRAMMPHSLVRAPAVDTGSFWISLDERERGAAWTHAVRQETPPDTVVVIRYSDLNVPSFTGRATWLSRAVRDDTPPLFTPGFNMNHGRYFEMFGYPTDLVSDRAAVLDELYVTRDAERFAEGLGRLRSLGRPLAIHFPTPRHAFLSWLKAEGIGRELTREGSQVVWFVEGRNLASEPHAG